MVQIKRHFPCESSPPTVSLRTRLHVCLRKHGTFFKTLLWRSPYFVFYYSYTSLGYRLKARPPEAGQSRNGEMLFILYGWAKRLE